MYEALKTRKIRGEKFYRKYLNGKVIDIGAGKDLVTVSAERFDIEEGDANHISLYRKDESYDTVHSSHCLEHMVDPRAALSQWWSLVKPGGYLVLVVPDEDLYEQGIWPSRFNSDHKHTFRLNNEKSWSPVSHDILKLVRGLPGAKIIAADIQDNYYDYSLRTKYPPQFERPPLLMRAINRLIRAIPRINNSLLIKFENVRFKYYKYPIDQTLREALAQIQIVAQKISDKNRLVEE